MNILLLGSGGRECALAWKLSQSSKLNKLFIAPGNAGTSLYGTNIPVSETDFHNLKLQILDNEIDMMIVGPEAPLAKGIVDFCRADGLLGHLGIIGPSLIGAQLESSKDFAKGFMKRHNIPTAKHASFNQSNIEDAYLYLKTMAPPYVIKANGLAAGKGVIICDAPEDARRAIDEMLLGRKFGEASDQVIIEEFLKGIEISVFVLTDGRNYVMLPCAKDYKRIGEGDTGLNTGGMGSVSPVPFANDAFMQKIEERIIKPTVSGLVSENIDYCGFIFFGLMNCQGDPYVIEYNVRLGDPETEAIIPRIESDLVELLRKTLEGQLKGERLDISEKHAVTVMLVSGGYPGEYENGKIITGLEQASGCYVFLAGAKTNTDGKIISNGGRVLTVTGMGVTLESAIQEAYAGAEKINFENVIYRRDIGRDLLRVQGKF